MSSWQRLSVAKTGKTSPNAIPLRANASWPVRRRCSVQSKPGIWFELSREILTINYIAKIPTESPFALPPFDFTRSTVKKWPRKYEWHAAAWWRCRPTRPVWSSTLTLRWVSTWTDKSVNTWCKANNLSALNIYRRLWSIKLWNLKLHFVSPNPLDYAKHGTGGFWCE